MQKMSYMQVLQARNGSIEGHSPNLGRWTPRAIRTLFSVVVLMTSFSALAAGKDEDVAERTDAAENSSQIAQVITRPYKAEYNLSRRGRNHGTAGRELSRLENGSWRYETFSRASLLLLSDRRFNDTVFQLAETRVEPLSFEYERRGTGSNRHYKVTFDREQQKLLPANGDPVTVEWQDDLLDPNAVLHQLQIDVALGQETFFTYPLVDDDGSLSIYEFEIDKREVIVLGDQRIETIRVSRVREHDRRQTYFWFAPEWNYTLVRMQQIEGGREAAMLNLTSLEFFE